MELSKVLKEKRIENQLTQEQLAEKLFISSKTISNWETGKTTPDIDSLIRLANLFHLSLDNLLLEGSLVVKNIKEQAELKNAKIFLSMTLVTNIVFLFIILSQDNFGILALPVLIAVLIGEMSNIIAMFYFVMKICKLEQTSVSEYIKAFVIAGLVFLLMIGIIYFFRQLF